MKNILFLHAGAEMYGADKVMLDLICGLDKKKYRPYVILPEEGVLVDALRKENINVKVLSYPIMRRKYFTPTGIFQYGVNLIKYSRQLIKIAKKLKIDIIHTNTAATIEGCFISRRLKIPQLWSIHEIIVNPKMMFKFTSYLIAKFSSITITDSNAVKQHLNTSQYFSDEDIKVIYNGVNSQRFNPDVDCKYLLTEWNLPSSAKFIGMMGRVNSWKGQKDFLDAANIVMEKHPDVYTILIGASFKGEEWRERELNEAIALSPFRDRIINRGYRTDSESIYKLFDVFVLPSINPDPLPTVVLEAMATGKPIVGYNHGGVCEMVKEGHNGLLAKVRDTEDLAAKINQLIDDDDLRNQMAINSRERLLTHFSIEAYIQNYSKEYSRLIRDSKNKKIRNFKKSIHETNEI